jgi:hypothetical protein
MSQNYFRHTATANTLREHENGVRNRGHEAADYVSGQLRRQVVVIRTLYGQCWPDGRLPGRIGVDTV